MQTAQRREDALAQRGIGGLAETLDETGDDFGLVHHRRHERANGLALLLNLRRKQSVENGEDCGEAVDRRT